MLKKRLLVALITLFTGIYAFAQNPTWINGVSSSNQTTSSNNLYVNSTGVYVAPINVAKFEDYSNAIFDNDDISIVKYDLDGNKVWVKNYGGSSIDRALTVCADANGNSYLAGYFSGTIVLPTSSPTTLTSAGGKDIFVMKLNSTGIPVWAIRGGGSADDQVNQIVIDNANNLYLAATVNGNGDLNIVSTYTATSTAAMLAKVTDAGVVTWLKVEDGTGADDAQGVAINSTNELYLGGAFSASVNFGGTTPLNSLGSTDAFLAKYDTNGNLLWAKSGGGTGTETVKFVTLNDNEDILLSGLFTATTTFGTLTALTVSGANDIFFTKYNASGNEVSAIKTGSSVLDELLSVSKYTNNSFCVVRFSPLGTTGTYSFLINSSNTIIDEVQFPITTSLTKKIYGLYFYDNYLYGNLWHNASGVPPMLYSNIDIYDMSAEFRKLSTFKFNYNTLRTSSIVVGSVANEYIVGFNYNFTPNANNVFTFELSDYNGVFTNPYFLGNLSSSTATSHTITVPHLLPTALDNKYNIRVKSSSPYASVVYPLIPNFAINTIATPLHANQNLNSNNVNAKINAEGSLFWDLSSSQSFETPIGSGKHSIFAANLAISATNVNDIYGAYNRYRQAGGDFQSGPIQNSYDVNYYTDWNKVWKINKTDIDNHITSWNIASYTMPATIANWPGNGNTAIGQSAKIAPYVDANNNGTYDPQNGDYPKIKGDQAIFSIYNDEKPHFESYAKSMKVEVKALAYSYNCNDSLLKNSIFIDFDITNKSNRTYQNLNIGMFNDFDLGDAFDDYVGCDASLNAVFAYNGDANDGTGFGMTYGVNPPAIGNVFLNKNINSNVAFAYGSVAGYGDPYSQETFKNVLSGLFANGQKISATADGQGFNPPYSTLMYSGDPNTAATWSENNVPNFANDRRTISAYQKATLAPNETEHFEIAYVVARDYTAPTNGNLASLALLKSRIAALQFPENDTIKGTVYANSVAVNGGKAILYNYQNYSRMSKVDSVDVDATGKYKFEGVKPGYYIVKVRPNFTNNANSNATYYGNSVYWEDALIVTTGCDAAHICDINLVQTTPLTGSTSLSGKLFKDGNYGNGVFGDPIAYNEVILTEPINLSSPLAVTYTDAQGNYTFSNVPSGTVYNLVVDIAGTKMGPKHEVIVSTGNIIEINYLADSMLIYKTGTPLGILSNSSNQTLAKIFPNPVENILNIQLDNTNSNKAVMEIIDLKGSVIFNSEMNLKINEKNSFQINLDETISSGIYTLKITTTTSSEVFKIVKN